MKKVAIRERKILRKNFCVGKINDLWVRRAREELIQLYNELSITEAIKVQLSENVSK